MKQLTTVFLILIGLLNASADTLTLRLTDILNDYPQTTEGYWEGTYNTGAITTDYFVFSHTGDADGGEMSYWEGFTLCTSNDTENYGAEGSSDGWLTHQWGCMAGGGLNDSLQTDPDNPYLVGYWGFYAESLMEDYHSLQITFTDNQPHQPIGVWICNHPWPYYGNINGDGFASAFSKEGDSFFIVAHGLNEKNEPTGGTVRLELASFHQGQLTQSKDWQYMDLTALGTVSGIYFTMETTDNDALYGANTAVYFCLDRLQVTDADSDPDQLQRPSGLTVSDVQETTLTLCWNMVANAEYYSLTIDDQYAGQTQDTFFVISDLQPLQSYTLSVTAHRANLTSDPAALTATTIDQTPPTTPTHLQTSATAYSITLTWNDSEDNVAVKRYTVYMDGEPLRRLTQTTYTVSGLEPATEYRFEIEAEDASGNTSPKAQITASTLAITDLRHILFSSPDGYYDLQGNYLGTKPALKGIYIRKSNMQISKTIVLH